MDHSANIKDNIIYFNYEKANQVYYFNAEGKLEKMKPRHILNHELDHLAYRGYQRLNQLAATTKTLLDDAEKNTAIQRAHVKAKKKIEYDAEVSAVDGSDELREIEKLHKRKSYINVIFTKKPLSKEQIERMEHKFSKSQTRNRNKNKTPFDGLSSEEYTKRFVEDDEFIIDQGPTKLRDAILEAAKIEKTSLNKPTEKIIKEATAAITDEMARFNPVPEMNEDGVSPDIPNHSLFPDAEESWVNRINSQREKAKSASKDGVAPTKL